MSFQSLALAFLSLTAGSVVALAQDDSTEVPSEDIHVAGNERMRYFLIGPKSDASPKAGYKLVVVLPGGDGGPDFHPFVKRLYEHALGADYLVAQLVAPVWSEGQAEELVWPTKKNSWPKMEFGTEEFAADVINDVGKRHKIDGNFIFTLSWSSSGPAAYAISLDSKTRVTGSFIAMSVFKPDQLPSLKGAKGHAYYLLHSPDDFIPILMAEDAVKKLTKKKAEVMLATYAGGHGWQGDVYGNMRAGFAWLEQEHAKVRKAKR